MNVTEYLQQASGIALQVDSGVWVRLTNNTTGTSYVSAAITDSSGKFTVSGVPIGSYTISTGPTSAGPWTGTGQGNYIVASDGSVASVPLSAVSGTPLNVKDYGAKGDGVTDDKTAITNAQAAQRSTGRPLYFPPGNYLVSGYITIGPGTVWIGSGVPAAVSTTSGTTITATGANAGIVSYRPGTIGNANPSSGQRQVFMQGILFYGGALGANSSGHLVTLARIVHATFLDCAFNNAAGTGLKDDGVTAIAAAGVYAFGCEILRFYGCAFENNTNATGNGGAGLMFETSVHIVTVSGCHFNGNVSALRLVSTDNGVLKFVGCDFNAGTQVAYCDVGGWYDLSFDTCWSEAQTAVGTRFLSSAAASACSTLSVRSCNIRGANTATAFTCTVDGAEFAGNRFDTWSVVYALTAGAAGGGFIEHSNFYTGVTNAFSSDAVQAKFYAMLSPGITGNGRNGLLQVPGRRMSQSVTLTYSASVNIDPGLGDFFYLTVTDTNPFALTVTAGDFLAGQRITLCIINSSGGVMGAITWPGAFFRVGTDWTNPASTKRRTISWISSGIASNWVQDGPASGDM